MACACSNDSSQSAQYDQSLSFLPEEMFDPLLPVEHNSKALTRLWDLILIEFFLNSIKSNILTYNIFISIFWTIMVKSGNTKIRKC